MSCLIAVSFSSHILPVEILTPLRGQAHSCSGAIVSLLGRGTFWYLGCSAAAPECAGERCIFNYVSKLVLEERKKLLHCCWHKSVAPLWSLGYSTSAVCSIQGGATLLTMFP